MTDLEQVRALLLDARTAFRADASVHSRLAECDARLDAPLRIALAGTVKAGKSTLLNALVGEEIAPSDATECTRVVTWFVRGRTPRIALTVGGRTRDLPIERRDGRLTLDLGDVGADRVEHLEVTWPSSLLDRYTVVDTPGTASNSREVSRRTSHLLAPPTGRCEVDAVVYLVRDMQRSDQEVLHNLRSPGTAGPLGVMTVQSRADEIDGGREWSAENTSDSTSLRVSGLLALCGRTLRQSEFEAFRTLATETDLERSLVSAERFALAAIDVEAEERRALVRRFGLVGIRCAVQILRSGVSTSPELAAELVGRSGLNALEHAIDTRFGARHRQLRAHSVLAQLQVIVEQRLDSHTAPLLTGIDRALADNHHFEEMALLSEMGDGTTGSMEWQHAALEKILGGHGIEPAKRLGFDVFPGAEELNRTGREAVRYWRTQLANPLLAPSRSRAYRAAARSAEQIVHDTASFGVAAGTVSVANRVRFPNDRFEPESGVRKRGWGQMAAGPEHLVPRRIRCENQATPHGADPIGRIGDHGRSTWPIN